MLEKFEVHTIVRIGMMLEKGMTPPMVLAEAMAVTPAFYETGEFLMGYKFPLPVAAVLALVEGTSLVEKFVKETKGIL